MRKIKKIIRSIVCKKNEIRDYAKLEIPINTCVHYAGFRYGCREFNPLEKSACDQHRGVPFLEVRRRFVDFLRYYRPNHLGEALGINLDTHYPLWAYPWRFLSKEDRSPTFGWHKKPEEIEDIITHYSEYGIISYLIDQEFFWQERALSLIARNSYQPEKYSYVKTLELRRVDQSFAHILIDGNHRVSALSALGYKSVVVLRDKSMIIMESDLEKWPEVKSGRMSLEDARAIFEVYFHGNHSWRTTKKPASIIANSDWKKLYLIHCRPTDWT
jgi:hypothetical protein